MFRLIPQIRYLGVVVALLATLGSAAQAQEVFPNKPVRLISPFPPAGPLDVMARIYAQKLNEIWSGRASAVVDAQAGASGTIGTQNVVKAAPDGYTLLITVDIPVTMAPALFPTPYDPRRDLTPVALLGETISMIAAHPSTGIRSLQELTSQAKANPGKLTFASGGNASPGHMCMELLKLAAGINMVHVPYKGAAPATAAILSGEVNLFCAAITAVLPSVRAGKLFALGTAGPLPSPHTPDIQPISKTYPEVALGTWFGVLAPPKTPPSVVSALQSDLRKVNEDPAIRQKLAAIGIDSQWITGSDFAAGIERDLAKWSRVIKAAGIKAD